MRSRGLARANAPNRKKEEGGVALNPGRQSLRSFAPGFSIAPFQGA